jgi:hypothetical protein
MNAECGMRNAECGMNRKFLLFIPHSAFRIPHSAFRIPHSSMFCLFKPRCSEHFAGVYRGRFVEHRMVERDQELIVAAAEPAGERLIAGLHHHAFPHHIPEILLCDPIFLPVIADDQCRLFYSHNY